VPSPSVSDNPRILVRCPGPPDPDAGAVVYWMQRAQRASDNPALDVAIAAGNLLGKPVVVLFVLVGDYPSANLRHYQFMLEGLRELPAALAARRVGFVVRCGRTDEVARFCSEVGAALLVGDENPLREPERWRRQVADAVRVPFWTVDADVIVPSALLEKEQFSAATIRPRIHRQLEWYLRPLPRRTAREVWSEAAAVRPPDPASWRKAPASRPLSEEDWLTLLDRLAVDARVGAVAGRPGGARAARRRLRAFLRDRLDGYAEARNEPAEEATSGLSPFLHFGQIGPREIALAVEASNAPAADRHAFLEEFVVRRELAVNFVRFNPRYDRLDGCERWALATLERHRRDERPWIYSESDLEEAETHDPLWNAAQRQMMETGWMHGYVRMYWAKKILEWSASPEEAMASAIALNDRYEIDGRDPNGYAGIAWAIGGKHDRPWGPERPIFGTVRYMSLASTSRKFDSAAYIRRWTGRSPRLRVPGSK
jgi:deoxyribodipyrimidine photo-lyase